MRYQLKDLSIAGPTQGYDARQGVVLYLRQRCVDDGVEKDGEMVKEVQRHVAEVGTPCVALCVPHEAENSIMTHVQTVLLVFHI